MLLNDDQIQFRDLIRKVFTETISPEYRLAWARLPKSSAEEISTLVDGLGLLEGFSGDSPLFSLADLGVVAHECGRVLFPQLMMEPLLISRVSSQLASAEDRNSLSSMGAHGAIAAPRSCNALTFSVDEAGGCVVSGAVPFVPVGKETASCIVWKVDWTEEYPVRAFIVSLSGKGVTCTGVPSIDLLKFGNEIGLDEAPATAIGTDASMLLYGALCTVVANEVAGLAEYVMEITTNYAKTREQFGVPIGGFQAVQQTLASCYVEAESLRALASFAAWSLSNSPEQIEFTSMTAVARAAAVGVSVCEKAVQAHGGIGFTWEYELHLYLRRARSVSALWGIGSESAAAIIAAAPLA